MQSMHLVLFFNLDIPAKQILWFSYGVTKELLIYFHVLLNPIGLDYRNKTYQFLHFSYSYIFLIMCSKGGLSGLLRIQ